MGSAARSELLSPLGSPSRVPHLRGDSPAAWGGRGGPPAKDGVPREENIKNTGVQTAAFSELFVYLKKKKKKKLALVKMLHGISVVLE